MRVPHICKPVTPPPVPAVYNLSPINNFSYHVLFCKPIFFILSLSMCEY